MLTLNHNIYLIHQNVLPQGIVQTYVIDQTCHVPGTCKMQHMFNKSRKSVMAYVFLQVIGVYNLLWKCLNETLNMDNVFFFKSVSILIFKLLKKSIFKTTDENIKFTLFQPSADNKIYIHVSICLSDSIIS